jgi:methionyl-tRNA formyltransferase
MKIIFMGTPDFAIPSLKILIESNHEVLAVVTAADKQRGRGQKVSFTPVKKFAVKNNLPLLQPEKFKNNPQLVDELRNYEADLYVVVAFRILPPELFNIPQFGSFNLHGSYLPKYRGAAPIQWALINGETETGLTTFKLAEKVDTGNIYLQKKVKIFNEDSLGTLHDRLSEIGAEIVLDTVGMIDGGNYKLLKQDDSLATPAPKITKEIAKVDWNKSAIEIHNLVRGLSPIPCAYFIHNEKNIKVYRSEIVERNDMKPGEFAQSKTELQIGCGENTLRILELQQEGKKRMGIEEFLRGFSFS